jgi:hypothetical protein
VIAIISNVKARNRRNAWVCLQRSVRLQQVSPLFVALLSLRFVITFILVDILLWSSSVNILDVLTERIEGVVIHIAVVKLSLTRSSSHHAVINSAHVSLCNLEEQDWHGVDDSLEHSNAGDHEEDGEHADLERGLLPREIRHYVVD